MGIFSLYKNYLIYVLKILIYEEYIKQLASSAIVQFSFSCIYRLYVAINAFVSTLKLRVTEFSSCFESPK